MDPNFPRLDDKSEKSNWNLSCKWQFIRIFKALKAEIWHQAIKNAS